MRTDTDQIEMFVIWLPVDQNQIGFDMTIAVIRPFTGKRVIKIAVRQRHVRGEQINNFHQGGIKVFSVPP